MNNENLVIGPVVSVIAACLMAFAGGTTLSVIATFLLAGPIATILLASVQVFNTSSETDRDPPALSTRSQSGGTKLKS